MRSTGRLQGAGAVACALALAATGTAFGGAPNRSVESEDETVQEGQTGSATVQCDQGESASGGGFRYLGDESPFEGPHLNGLYPVNKRTWTAEVDNGSSEERGLEAWAVCFRDAKFTLASRVLPPLRGGPPVTRTAKAKCPRGTHVAGGGFDSTGDFNSTQVAATMPKGDRTWLTRVELTNSNDVLSAYAVCDSEAKYKMVKKEFIGEPAFRRTNVDVVDEEVRCPQGYQATSGGYERVDDSDGTSLFLMPSMSDPRSWQVHMRWLASIDPPMTAYALCRKG